MRTKVFLIGHSEFPSGIKKGLEFIANLKNEIITFAIDHNHSVSMLENNLTKSLKQDVFNLVFADLPGGSPHQIAVKVIQEQKLTQTIVIAGAGLGLILDLCLKLFWSEIKNANFLKAQINQQMKKLNNFVKINQLEN